MTAFDELMVFQRETEALAQVAGRLSWDQETMMPRGAAPQRAEESAALETVLHARRVDPKVGDWLAMIDEANLDDVGRAQLRHIRRSHWAAARAAEDVRAFVPTLSEVITLKREEGLALSAGGDVYDAMLNDYEPGATGAELEAMFGALRPELSSLREAVREAEAPPQLEGRFDEAAQMKLTRQLAKTFGYDMSMGRVDKAVHPFSSGSGLDVPKPSLYWVVAWADA